MITIFNSQITELISKSLSKMKIIISQLIKTNLKLWLLMKISYKWCKEKVQDQEVYRGTKASLTFIRMY